GLVGDPGGWAPWVDPVIWGDPVIWAWRVGWWAWAHGRAGVRGAGRSAQTGVPLGWAAAWPGSEGTGTAGGGLGPCAGGVVRCARGDAGGGVVDLGRGPAETAGVSLGDDVVDLEAFGGGAAFTGVRVDVGALPAVPGEDGPADAGREPP